MRAAPQHLCTTHPCIGGQLLDRPGLSDSWLSHQHDDAASTSEGVVESNAQAVQLAQLLDPKVFKAYDIRGIYPTELDEEGAYAIGRAYVEQFEPKEIAVGRDMRESSPSMAKALIDKGANLSASDGFDPKLRTPLMSAVEGGHEEVVKLLLARGANRHTMDEAGDDAFVYAENKHPELTPFQLKSVLHLTSSNVGGNR